MVALATITAVHFWLSNKTRFETEMAAAYVETVTSRYMMVRDKVPDGKGLLNATIGGCKRMLTSIREFDVAIRWTIKPEGERALISVTGTHLFYHHVVTKEVDANTRASAALLQTYEKDCVLTESAP